MRIKEAERKKYAVQEAQRNGYVVGNVKGTKRRNTNSANLRNTQKAYRNSGRARQPL